MAKRVSRRQLLAGAAPVVAAAPIVKLGWPSAAEADTAHVASHVSHRHPALGHAAMIGDEVPAPGGPRDLDALLVPPPALPHRPGRVREYRIAAVDREFEV